MFPDDVQNFRIPKILKNAYKWGNKKKLKTESLTVPDPVPEQESKPEPVLTENDEEMDLRLDEE